MSGADLIGMLVIDKPAGVTSHDVVLRVRKCLGVRAGHTGTLDPQATGVLLVCVGAATRLARFLQHDDKVYECTVRLGFSTDTYDAEGTATSDRVPVPQLDPAEIELVLERFRGQIHQIPPVYSAKKIRGQPAYRRARRGEVVEHAPIRVQVHALQLLGVEPERLRLRVHCGPGTYVRTLAHDIGQALGYPSHLEALRRLRVGSFDLQSALDEAQLEAASPEQLQARLLPPSEMLPGWPRVVLNDAGRAVLRHGGVIEPRHVEARERGSEGAVVTGSGATWVQLRDTSGAMLAAGETLPGGMLQPRIVLVS